MPHLLILSHEAPGPTMSGPAIRYWHIAHALAETLEVTLAVPAPCALTSSTVQLLPYDRATGEPLRAALAQTDVVLIAGFLLQRYPFLRHLPQPLVVDLYDPFLFENLILHAQAPWPTQLSRNRFDRAVLADQLQRGDFFLCASAQQRDFWLGMLAASGRINPATFRADPTLQQLIALLPFGLPEAPASAGPRPVLKGIYPGIATTDRVVYWGGGLWDWFDPLTAVRAIALLAPQHSNVKLFFAGVQHPNPDVPVMPMVTETQRLSAQLGLTDKHVFFNRWLPYADRAAYLCEADVGLSLHPDHIETRFAFRTRLLDYLWASLPMVVTAGDVLGDQFAAKGLALPVPPANADAVAQALIAALTETPSAKAARQQRAQALAQHYRWSNLIAPLRTFCQAPHRAADYQTRTASPTLDLSLVAKAWHSLRTRGPAGLWHDLRLFFRR